jgi:hypothetical protein
LHAKSAWSPRSTTTTQPQHSLSPQSMCGTMGSAC